MPRKWRDRRYTNGPDRYRRRRARRASEIQPESRRWSWLVKNGLAQRRKCGPMIAAEVEARATIGDRAHQNGLLRPEVITGIGFRQFFVNIALNRHQVEDSSRKVPDFPPLLVRHVPGHG